MPMPADPLHPKPPLPVRTVGYATTAPKALIGWRALSLTYDFFPVLALWWLVGGAALALHGGEPIQGGLPGALEFAALTLFTGGYAVLSWRGGGQTLGMRPWRLYVVAPDGHVPQWRRLVIRFLVGTISLLLLGAGFWWAWLDRDRLTWHDRLSGTRTWRGPKGG